MKANLLHLIFLLLLSLSGLKAQYVDIPDPVFREWLETEFTECMQDGQLDTTCEILFGIEEFVDDIYLPQDVKNLYGIQYFKDLKWLNYDYGVLEEIPVLPPSLEKLYINQNGLTQLPELPATLIELSCAANQLTYLPQLPASLKQLECGNNLLERLPELPGSLELLSCQENLLLTLPVLPATLTVLYCDGNKLTYLPSLPEGLIVLFCTVNRILSLPVLPSTLIKLWCGDNNISEIPALPPHLVELYLYNNNLVTLPELPNSLNQLDVSNNPNLTCLPVLPNSMGIQIIIGGFLLQNLFVTGTGIACLPNRPGLMYVSPEFLPVCEDASSNCQNLAVVQGRVFVDENDNGTFDPETDAVVPEVVIHAIPTNRSSVTSINGEYTLLLDTAAINIWTAIAGPYWNTAPSSYSLEPSITGTQAGLFDFALQSIGSVNDLEVNIGAGPLTPGFKSRVIANAANVGTTDQSNVNLVLRKPAGYQITFSEPPYSGLTNNTITWSGISLDKLESKRFMLVLRVPETIELGSAARFESWITSAVDDTIQVNNYAVWTDTVVGSFDPNDKLVNLDILADTYSEEDRLLYTIRFQNTGTAKAYTVVVRDEIPDNLDISSLRVVNASHPYQLIVREKNIVEVAFPNIQLPDSNSNEPASHGFVQLSLKPIAGLPVDEEIKNSASIFFDYNAPVITNEAVTTVSIISGIASNRKLDFKVFPNPASQLLRIELPYSEEGKWLLSDISGRVLHENYFPSGSHQLEIPVNLFPAGTYFLTLQMGGERSTAKVVLLR